MPRESLNGFFIRDALVNGRFEEVRDKSYWTYGFLSAFRLFTSIDGQVFKRYRRAFSELDQTQLESSHTLIPLYRCIERTYPLVDHKSFNLNSKSGLLTEKKVAIPLVCPICYRDQVDKYGFNWLRIEWQNPYAPYCFKHDCSLIDYEPVFLNQFPMFLGAKTTELHESTDLDKHLASSRRLSGTLLELYRWFYDLFDHNLPHLDIRRQQAILARAYCRMYGEVFSSREELIDGLARAFNRFTCDRDSPNSASSRDYKWFYHPHYDQRYIKQIIEGSNANMSSSHYWTLVFLAYKDFGVFMEKCADIFKNIDTPILIDLK